MICKSTRFERDTRNRCCDFSSAAREPRSIHENESLLREGDSTLAAPTRSAQAPRDRKTTTGRIHGRIDGANVGIHRVENLWNGRSDDPTS